MKRVAAGFAAVLIAASTFAQQAPRPQVQKVAPAGPDMEEVLSTQRAPAPLTGQQRLQVYGRALATPGKLDSGELGAPVRITPRNLYVNATTYAANFRGSVDPSQGATGVATVLDTQAKLEIHFRAAANKAHIVDCSLAQGSKAVQVSIENVTSMTVVPSSDHLVFAVPSSAQARPIKATLRGGGFWWTSCEIVPVSR